MFFVVILRSAERERERDRNSLRESVRARQCDAQKRSEKKERARKKREKKERKKRAKKKQKKTPHSPLAVPAKMTVDWITLSEFRLASSFISTFWYSSIAPASRATSRSCAPK